MFCQAIFAPICKNRFISPSGTTIQLSVDNLPKTVDNLSELGKTRSFFLFFFEHIPLYMGAYPSTTPDIQIACWIVKSELNPKQFSPTLLGRIEGHQTPIFVLINSHRPTIYRSLRYPSNVFHISPTPTTTTN